MSWPLGEIKALATKASRGAGLSWALADEAGYATQWLELHGVAGVSHLANYLQWIEENGSLDAPIDVLEVAPDEQSLKCPIALGCFIADSKKVVSDANFRVRQPALLIPFIGLVAGEQTIVCSFDDVPISVCVDGIDHSMLDLPALNFSEASLRWQITKGADISCTKNSRASGNEESIDILMHLAARTYAPATQSSRLAGAGTGSTNDND